MGSKDTGKGYRALTNIGGVMEDKKFLIYTFIYLEVKELEKWLSDIKRLKETIWIFILWKSLKK